MQAQGTKDTELEASARGVSCFGTDHQADGKAHSQQTAKAP